VDKVLWHSKDYSMEYLKTSISINSYVGCNLGCEYCILSTLEFPERPLKIMDEDAVVMQLLENCYFIRDVTPISINNKSDPWLPEVKESTFQILKLLEQQQINNPIYLISKLELTENDIDFLDALDLRIYVFFSISGLKGDLERLSEKYHKRRVSKLASAKNIKKIHYWRPLIMGENDSDESIRMMLQMVHPVFDASVVSGLRVNEAVYSRLKNLEKEVPYNEYTKKHKFVEKEVFDRIHKIRNEVCPDYLLFRHTSCVTSYWMGQPDFLHNNRKPQNCAVFHCPNTWRCQTRRKPDSDTINMLLYRINRTNEYEIREDHILFKGELTQEDLSFLNLNLQFKSFCGSLLLSASESVIEVS
jgi:DNA repair photolyase